MNHCTTAFRTTALALLLAAAGCAAPKTSGGGGDAGVDVLDGGGSGTPDLRATGCSSDNACDGGVCEADGGTCVPCLPDRDVCAAGRYCTRTNGAWNCALGCMKDDICKNVDGGAPTLACCDHVCVDTARDDAHCMACGNACANGKACCNAACLDLAADPNNCGGCGKACQLANATASCAMGKCGVAMCAKGFANCNQMPADGCEVDTNVDPKNCLGCGMACSLPHGTAGCMAGCTVASCNTGFADCNKVVGDGCEVDVTMDAKSCGQCGQACPNVPNGTAGCAMSKCTIASCNAKFADCNQVFGDGCEVDTDTDAKSCGMCGKACPPVQNGSSSCVAGACTLVCNVGFKDCNNNPADGCEININTDPNGCGGCGKVCSGANMASRTCAAGACNGACLGGFADCNSDKLADGCEVNTGSDPNSCGACGTVCSPNNMLTRTCSGGSCNGTCNGGFADCNGNKQTDGCETSVNGDPNACGGCGKVCSNANMASRTCSGGACNGACTAGFADCNGDKLVDGCEANLNTDPNRCGGCNSVCSGNNMQSRTCSGGTCNGACAPGAADCNGNKLTDGCEVITASDPNSCGGCGTVCSPSNMLTRTCSGGACNGACDAGFADCDGNKQTNGCEIATTTDPNNCGLCGRVCSGANMASRTCGGSVCNGNCNAGFGDCNGNKQTDGCESSITTDPNNCGGCGTICSSTNMASRTCGGGTCNGNCSAGFADCDANKQSNGCETGTSADANNCGGCGKICSGANMASRTCSGGLCNGTCAASFDDCNANKLLDGCETAHNTNPVVGCGDPVIGAVSGDTGADLITRAANTEQFYWVTVREDSSNSIYLSAEVKLVSPAGADYNLCVTCLGCGGSKQCSNSAVLGGTDTVYVGRDDTGGFSDTHDVLIEISYASGSSCANWNLSVTGDVITGNRSCN